MTDMQADIQAVIEDATQHGVKGQKWGVSKESPGASSHAASGAAKAKMILVDEHYAKRAAAIGGVAVLGIGAAAFAPAVIPAGVIAAAGGSTVLSAKIALASTVGTRVAFAHNYLSYAKRAKARAVSVAHDDLTIGDRTVGQVYEDLTPPKKLAANLLIDACSRGVEFSDNRNIQGGWAEMTPIERSVVLFLASGVDIPDAAVEHSDVASDILKSIIENDETGFMHSTLTIQDVYDQSSPEEQDVIDIVIASALAEDPLPSDISEAYSALSDDQRNITEFIVGAAADSEVSHDALEHHGVKGQKWGVSKAKNSAGGLKDTSTPETRAGARASVKAGTASLGEAHAAALKSTGHRVANAVLGDKTYWKRELAIAAVAGAGIAAAATVPGLLPAAVVAHGLSAHTILLSTAIATRGAGLENAISNTARAIRGNTRVNNSFKAMGTQITGHQNSGSKKVQKVLTQSGSLRPSKVAAHTIPVDDILKSIVLVEETDAEQHGIKGQKWGIRRDKDSATGRVEMVGNTGLRPRTGSADQIAQDRIAKKLATDGVKSVSNADIQSYTRRLQAQRDLQRVLDQQSAEQKLASQNFVTRFVKKQADRQTNRIVDAAADIAVEKALASAGLHIGKKGHSPDAADMLVKISGRITPKKKGK